MKIFLDSSVLRRFSLGTPVALLVVAGCLTNAIHLCTSSYALQEWLLTLTDDAIPPKARLASLIAVGFALGSGALYVKLSLPTAEEAQRAGQGCRDPEDWPILADAIAAEAEIVLTEDRDLLEAVGYSFRTCPLDQFLGEWMGSPEGAAFLARVEAVKGQTGSSPPSV
jgi:predicted nucleic acid-binding protein